MLLPVAFDRQQELKIKGVSKTRGYSPMLAAEIHHRHAAFALLPDRRDLRVSKSRFLHARLRALTKPERYKFEIGRYLPFLATQA
jgi:hypothetical protein